MAADVAGWDGNELRSEPGVDDVFIGGGGALPEAIVNQ